MYSVHGVRFSWKYWIGFECKYTNFAILADRIGSNTTLKHIPTHISCLSMFYPKVVFLQIKMSEN